MPNQNEFLMGYYIRDRGRVRGPLELERVRAMVERGRIGRHLQMSVDGKTWQRAAEFPEIFESQTGRKIRQPKEDSSADIAVTVDSAAEVDWYYTQFGEKHGPVAFDEMRRLIEAGTVTANAFVWNESMTDWVAVSQEPSVAAFVPVQRASTRGGRRSAGPRTLAWQVLAMIGCCTMAAGAVTPWWGFKYTVVDTSVRDADEQQRLRRQEEKAEQITKKYRTWYDEHARGEYSSFRKRVFEKAKDVASEMGQRDLERAAQRVRRGDD